MDINKLHKVYFLGIGGIGMSAIARYLNNYGVKIFGYDKTPSQLTYELISEGMCIHFEENINLIPENIDLVIYTPAIPKDHSEYIYFIENNYKILKRSEFLGKLTENTFNIAISGTHGKTTITCMISHILKSADVKINAFIGGISKNYNTNLILSDESNITVVEADEYDRSFLTLNPDIEVITAIDADHLDIYGSLEYLKESFELFAKRRKPNGKLIYKHNIILSEHIKNQSISYSLKSDSNYHTDNIRIENGYYIYDIVGKTTIKNVKLGLPGLHNVENSVVAAAIALEMGISEESIKKALDSFKGVKRRFDYIVKTDKILYIDDYAHHPEEIKATILSVKELFPGKKITGVFQPHLYTRTRDLADDFANSLDLLDNTILLDIYPARELPIENVNSQMLLDKMNSKNKKLCKKENILDEIEIIKPEILITLGAGDIDQLVDEIENYLLTQYL